MSEVVTPRGEPLSVRLRAATRYGHERAEASPFLAALPAGRLDRGAYAALPGQGHHFRAALEQAGEVWRHHGVVGPFVCAALLRRTALEADLAWLADTDRLCPLWTVKSLWCGRSPRAARREPGGPATRRAETGVRATGTVVCDRGYGRCAG